MIENSSILVVNDIDSTLSELLPKYPMHSTRVIKNEEKDETALLTNATRNIVLTQKAVIDDLNAIFDEIANGDFTVCSKDTGIYRGDYIGILKATDRLKNKMKSSFSNIKSSIETISEGALQVAEISQHLAGNVENQNNVVSDFEKSISEIADSPTREDAKRAASFLLEEMFSNMPFKDQASKANTLAGLLSPIVRPMIKGLIPMMLIDKPSPGTGASLRLRGTRAR